MMRQVGIRCVVGIPAEHKPIVGLPDGARKLRLRFRPDEFARLFVQTPDGAAVYLLRDDPDAWVPLAQGENRTAKNEEAR